MTQQSVEILIGKLLTDEELREAFQLNPHGVLLWLLRQGLQLSRLEMDALKSIKPSDLSGLADMIDRRLQKASLRGRHMTHTTEHTETLPTAPLGTTGMRITRVGFGAWAIGGGGWTFAWGDQDDTDSIAAIRHAVERGVNWIDTALLQLKEEGKVRAVGLSNHDVAQLEAAERVGHVDTLQPPFSAIHREVAAADLPWCAAHRTGVIVYSPMQSGLLTGAFSVARAAQLGAGDWRSRSPDFTGLGLRRNVALADALQPIAERHRATVAAVAVAWTLAWPGVTGAIVGARSPAQVDGWIGAASLELTDADLDEVAAAIRRTGAGTGSVRP